MKIDKNKLVELLVEKTNMDQQEVENQLQQLIERIKDAANRGKALEIKEFGLFYFDEEGNLKFDAADELSTEISFKYAGMKPVELKPERDTSIPSFEEEQEDEDLDDFDFLSDIEEERSTDEESGDDSFEGSGTDEAPSKEPSLKRKKMQPRSRGNNSMVWVFAAIIILAVIIGGYVYLMDSSSSSTTAEQSSPALAQTEEQGNAGTESSDEEETITAADNTEGEESDDEGSPAEDSIEVESSVQTPEEIIPTDPAEPETDNQVSTNQSLYGLEGSVVEEANSGYSIVVHSFNSEESARTTAASLTDDGYRAIVGSRTVADRTMWRVSLGQFETLTDAQSAAGQLPSPYNTQNFIHRIQLN